MKWIKSSILKSELNKLFDLSNIDWKQCAKFANKNIIKEVCDYWNNRKDGETIVDIAETFNIAQTSARNYLKRGAKLGWCDYDSKEELRKSVSKNGRLNRKKVEIFKDNKSLGIFSSCSELERQSEKLFGVRFLHGNMSSVCTGKKPQYKGFTFKYVEEDNNSNILKIA